MKITKHMGMGAASSLLLFFTLLTKESLSWLLGCPKDTIMLSKITTVAGIVGLHNSNMSGCCVLSSQNPYI